MSLMFLYIVLILVNIFAWYPVLNFWFSRGWEQGWLIGICGNSYTIICLMKGHGFLYLINYLLFGWNASGWYLTAMTLHIIVVLLIFGLTIKLTKRKLFAFIVALFFSVNVAHNDVVTWGSFEGLYALVMVCFLASIFIFQKFREEKTSKKYVWYGLTILIHLFALFIRESGTLVPALLLISDLFFLLESKTNLFSKKVIGFSFTSYYIKRYLFHLIPFFIISIAYLKFRSWYGGAPNDIIDEMVRLKNALIEQGRYGEYLLRSALAYGKFEGAHIVPYPTMNVTRDILLRIFPFEWIRLYFFSMIGLLYTIFQMLIIYWYRKINIRNILIYSFLWNAIATSFFSFALPLTDYGLLIDYVWDTSRWRYFSLFGTLLFWTAVGFSVYKIAEKKFFKHLIIVRAATLLLILIYFIVQFMLLRSIEDTMYKERFKPAKDFYTFFLKEFPTLPKDYFIYVYPYSAPLNDYIYEWYYIRQVYYPNLTDERIKKFGEGIIGMFLERFSKGTANIDTTFFLDYNPVDGLQNRTADAKNILFNQTKKVYPISKTIPSSQFRDLNVISSSAITINLDPAIHVETPYTFEITLSANPTQKANSQKSIQMDSFVKNRMNFLNNTKIEVCGTAPSGSLGSPASYVLPTNLIDGNFGRRSLWIANCMPGWVLLDLGERKKIGGMAFHAGKNSTNYPTDYTIEISLDGAHWKEVNKTTKNDSFQRIHIFSEPVEASFVRFTVDQTAEGQMATLDEVEIIDIEDTAMVKEFINDFTKLIEDSYGYGGVMRFSWNTDPNNWQPYETKEYNSIYRLFSVNGVEQNIIVTPNENEFFSSNGQFLKRKITDFTLDFFGQPSVVTVDSVRVRPLYPINKK